jgi:UDP-MurNAc hydroxylase
LLVDPWVEGDVFNNGWRLYSPTKLQSNDYSNIDFIWFSHEHPDHFYPPNIKKIPKEYRGNITVLYQKTNDRKVLNFCKALGFKVAELPHHTWVTIAEKTEVMCGPVGLGDSWLCFKNKNGVYLNLNDCPVTNVERAEYIKSRLNLDQPVEVIFGQFSPGGWTGNQDDIESLNRRKKAKLDSLKMQVSSFQSKFSIPFASFFYFCHEDNFYLNSHRNSISEVYRTLKEETRSFPVVLYPGQEWTIGEEISSNISIKQYESDLKSVLKSPNLNKSEKVDFETLYSLFETYKKKIKKHNFYFAIKHLKPAKIFLEDHNKTVIISFNEQLKYIEETQDYDIKMKSSIFSYCLKFPWGGDTLLANGCYEIKNKKRFTKFYLNFLPSILNNSGQKYPWGRYKLSLLTKVIDKSLTFFPAKKKKLDLTQI